MSDKEEFKKGDIVYLKSGSPNMVIDYIENHLTGKCICSYCINNEIKTITLHFASLTKA